MNKSKSAITLTPENTNSVARLASMGKMSANKAFHLLLYVGVLANRRYSKGWPTARRALRRMGLSKELLGRIEASVTA